MKMVPFLFLLFGIGSVARDTRWQHIAIDRYEGDVYLDVESVERTGNVIGFWESLRYKSPVMYSNIIYDEVYVRYEATCGLHFIRTTSYLLKLHGTLLHSDIRNYSQMPLTSAIGLEIAYKRYCNDGKTNELKDTERAEGN